MHSYAIQDVEVTVKLFKLIENQNYSQKAIDLEHQVATIMGQCERFGFSFDEDAACSLIADLSAERASIEAELRDTFEPWYSFVEEVTPKRTINYKNRPGTVEGAAYSKVKLNVFNPSSRQQIADRLCTLFGWQPTELTPTGQARVDETTMSKLAQ